jgi:Protein of unknown function (DUF3800)
MIFVDESAVKASAGRFFVVGAVKVRKPGQLLRSVQDIRDRHGYTGRRGERPASRAIRLALQPAPVQSWKPGG